MCGSPCDCQEFDPCGDVGPIVDSWVARSDELGLEWDEACERSLPDLWPNYCAVGRQAIAVAHSCATEWQLFSGKQEQGQACERVGRRISDCRQGLVCGIDGTCHPPCNAPLEIPEGGDCSHGAGVMLEQCAKGFVCAQDDGACVTAAALGQPCSADMPCVPDAHCRFGAGNTGICEALREADATCEFNSQCISDFCQDGTCKNHPWSCTHTLF